MSDETTPTEALEATPVEATPENGEATPTAQQLAENPADIIAGVVANADITGATPHHIIDNLFHAIKRLGVQAQIEIGVAQKIYFEEINGLKGQIKAYLVHADQDTLEIVHKLLVLRVPLPTSPGEETQETPVVSETETSPETSEVAPTNIIPVDFSAPVATEVSETAPVATEAVAPEVPVAPSEETN